MLILSAVISAVLNVAVIGGVPFLIYFAYHRLRHKRSFAEVARRAGLRKSERKYLLYCALFAAALIAVLSIWRPPLAPFLKPTSPQHVFAGLGMSTTAVVLALLYGVVKTGFPEELLFRGLIAGSLSRRLPLIWANLIQAVVFMLPHLLLLRVAPELAPLLLLTFLGALFNGWVRIRSGSIVGPWLVHAALNVSVCISVALLSS